MFLSGYNHLVMKATRCGCCFRSASPHHGFAAYYTYLEQIWQADAVLHFGTHGSGVHAR